MLNVRTINKEVNLNILGGKWLAYMVAVAVPALAGWGAEYGILALTEAWIEKLSYLLAAAVTSVIVGGLYLILLAALRVITPEDVRSFPGPLRKMLNLVLKPFYRKAV